MNKNNTLLLISFSISIVGDWLLRLAVPIYIFNITQSAKFMSFAFAIYFVPVIIIMPFAGVISDSFNRKYLLIFADFFSFFFTVVIYITMALHAPVYIFFILLFVLAWFSSLQHPTFQSFIPQITKYAQLDRMNANVKTVENIVESIAPIFGGTIILFLGTKNAIFFDGITFLLSLLLIIFIQYHDKIERLDFHLKDFMHHFIEGAKLAMQNPIIKWGTILFIFTNFSFYIIFGNILYFFLHIQKFNASEIGLIFSIAGVGAVIGAFITPRLNKNISKGRFMIYSLMLETLGFF